MKVFIVIILVAIAGYLGYRILSKPKPAEATISEAQPAPEPTSAPAPNIVISKAPATTDATRAAVTNRTVARMKDPATQAVKPKATGAYKAKMELILGSNGTAEQKIHDLKEMLSTLDEAEAEAAVQDLTSRVRDEGYSFVKSLAVDPTLPEPVRDEFMVDMLNRPNSVKMPLLLEIARNPDHPDHESAFDSLEAFTGLKYGADWNGWEKGIQGWLKENPDQPRRSQQPQGQPEPN